MDDQELFDTAQGVRILASIVTKLAAADQERRLEASGAGISVLQHGVLRLLCHQECTLSEVSRTMSLTAATLVPVVDALERKGFVKRGQDLHDRRRTPLSVTEEGQAVLKRVPFMDRGDLLLSSLAEIGPEKSGQLLTLLGELVMRMSKDESLVGRVCAGAHLSTVENH